MNALREKLMEEIAPLLVRCKTAKEYTMQVYNLIDILRDRSDLDLRNTRLKNLDKFVQGKRIFSDQPVDLVKQIHQRRIDLFKFLCFDKISRLCKLFRQLPALFLQAVFLTQAR